MFGAANTRGGFSHAYVLKQVRVYPGRIETLFYDLKLA